MKLLIKSVWSEVELLEDFTKKLDGFTITIPKGSSGICTTELDETRDNVYAVYFDTPIYFSKNKSIRWIVFEYKMKSKFKLIKKSVSLYLKDD